MNWREYTLELHRTVSEFTKLAPQTMQGVQILGSVPAKHLDSKMHELIALSVAVTTRCDSCIAVHTKAALEAGVTKEQIAEALGVAISLNAGAALSYSARVMGAIDSLKN